MPCRMTWALHLQHAYAGRTHHVGGYRTFCANPQHSVRIKKIDDCQIYRVGIIYIHNEV